MEHPKKRPECSLLRYGIRMHSPQFAQHRVDLAVDLRPLRLIGGLQARLRVVPFIFKVSDAGRRTGLVVRVQ